MLLPQRTKVSFWDRAIVIIPLMGLIFTARGAYRDYTLSRLDLAESLFYALFYALWCYLVWIGKLRDWAPTRPSSPTIASLHPCSPARSDDLAFLFRSAILETCSCSTLQACARTPRRGSGAS